MKKLLSLLAAVGLTATAGSAVVACGGTKDDNKETRVNIKDAKIPTEVEVGFSLDIVKGQIHSAIKDMNSKAVVGTDYKITGDTTKVGDITVKAEGKSTNIIGDFTIKVVETGKVKARDIKDAKFDPIGVGKSIDEIAQKAIGGIIFGAVKGTDYVITGNTTEAKADAITVKFVEGSKKLTGEIKLAVVTNPISGIEIKNVTAGMEKATVEGIILEAVKGVAANTAVSAKDYTIIGLKDKVAEKEEITVTAIADSKFISGNFKFTVVAATVDIKVDKDSVEIASKGKADVKVSEFTTLVNAKVAVKQDANKDNVTVSTIDKDGKFTITSAKEVDGSATVTITADNATAPKDITVTIKVTTAIVVEQDTVDLAIKGSAVVEIKNIGDLVGVKVAPKAKEDEAVVSVTEFKDGKFKITGLEEKAGSATVTITAENGTEAKDITVNIKAAAPIEVEKDTVDLAIKGSAVVEIKNIGDLVGVKVAPKAKEDEAVVSVTEFKDGKFKINGLEEKAGSATVTITAENGTEAKDITVNIKAAAPIEVEKDTVDLAIKGSAVVEIKNIGDLVGVKVAPKAKEDEAVVSVTEFKDGKFKINGLEEKAGSATVTITAENGTEAKDITVNIK